MSVIEHLLELHLVDRQVRGLRSRVETAEIYHRTQQKQLEDIEGKLDQIQQQCRVAQATAANLETEGNSIDARIEKFREDLKLSATTKQYNTVLEEINTFKTERGQVDEQALAQLEQAENLEKDMEGLDARIAERKTLVESAESDLNERRTEVSDRLNELEIERAQKAEAIPPEVLEVFDQTADDYEGDTMAEIEEIDLKRLEYNCSSCNVSLPFNLVNTIMSNANNVHQCEGCMRILYVTEEVRGALLAKK